MMSTRKEGGQKPSGKSGYSLLDSGIDDDFLPTTRGDGGGGVSLVDRLEASGIMHSSHKAPPGGRGEGSGAKVSGTQRGKVGDNTGILSPLNSVTSTPARGRRERYNSDDDDGSNDG